MPNVGVEKKEHCWGNVTWYSHHGKQYKSPSKYLKHNYIWPSDMAPWPPSSTASPLNPSPSWVAVETQIGGLGQAVASSGKQARARHTLGTWGAAIQGMLTCGPVQPCPTMSPEKTEGVVDSGGGKFRLNSIITFPITDLHKFLPIELLSKTRLA